jgi:hypothetical protein
MQPGAWDIRGIDSDFKYRVWFTWHLLKSSAWNIAGHGAVESVARTLREADFWKSVRRQAEDIWFWEDEDEEYIKAFIDDRPDDRFFLEMSEAEWSTACLALEARDRQQCPSPFSHLTPEARLRFTAWLIVVALYPKVYRFPRAHLGVLLQSWSHSIAESQLPESCRFCGVSTHLNLWMETMLHIYSTDDLQSILWDYPCSCFHE